MVVTLENQRGGDGGRQAGSAFRAKLRWVKVFNFLDLFGSSVMEARGALGPLSPWFYCGGISRGVFLEVEWRLKLPHLVGAWCLASVSG